MTALTSTADVREAFLRYFEDNGHTRVSSSSLVPGNDPTLLFTNAGMVQFKDVFLGDDPRSYTTATSSQRCVRAGGKHNDLENVGYTARHHTFFEMLGNFSFGDYFKEKAIPLAWNFLTKTLKLPTDRLWVTIYAEDDEAFDIWHKKVGLPEDRIIRIGDNKGARYASDNFWSMGDTGPCGPCTEIFYDHGEHIEGGLPGTPEEDGDRYIEVWNVVFMQYNRSADGSMTPLPAPSVDTGMGLERIVAVMQHVNSNYDIDLFKALIGDIASSLTVKDLTHNSLKVVADHIRSCAFLVADGVVPSNEGRGYVLRRIIRRAVRHGSKLGAEGIFFSKIVASLVRLMGDAYPELRDKQAQIEEVLRTEEQQFALTLQQGLKILETEIAKLSNTVIPGDVAFKLYDTYGFPLDLTADIAREKDLTVDEDGYQAAMQIQRDKAKAASSFSSSAEKLDLDALAEAAETQFTGYNDLINSANVIGLYLDGQSVRGASSGDEVLAVLDQTPFYAESGGQIGDKGTFVNSDCETIATVMDTQKQNNTFIHNVKLAKSLGVGDSIQAVVDNAHRQAVTLNHSSTHLLHAALRQVLGDQVEQKGSLVQADRLRFDFAFNRPVTSEELVEVSNLVNSQIRGNSHADTEVTDMEGAKAAGAMALFGEKYGDEVRVLAMGDRDDNGVFSVELCGGTHVERVGDIGLFTILSESGIAAGVRRIEATSGSAAIDELNKQSANIAAAASLVKTQPENLSDKLTQLLDNQKALEKELGSLKQKLASSMGADLAGSAETIGDAKLLVSKLEGVDPKSLRTTVDRLKEKLGDSVIVLAAPQGEKVSIVAGVSDGLQAKVKAGDVIKQLAVALGGKGGGKPSFAQGGGTDVAAVDKALTELQQNLKEAIS